MTRSPTNFELVQVVASRAQATPARGHGGRQGHAGQRSEPTRWRGRALWAPLLLTVGLVLAIALVRPPVAAAVTTTGPLHTNGVDTVIYNSANEPVRLVGFNWTGMETGGRNDYQKAPDGCDRTWNTPADHLSGLTLTYDDFYQNLRTWGYNVIRLPVQWHNLEPVAPSWDAQAGRYVHTWNQNYLNDLRSMVTKARAAGIMVILDMQQDFWSPALHNITNWDGTPGYCEGYGMPRWMYPSIDAKTATTQNTDFYNGMNWFFRNMHDPMATVTKVSPWQLYGDVWRMLSYEFSPASGFADSQAVVGADLFNEPWWSYVGGSPPAGQTVAQAAGSRLLAFYNSLAPSITGNSPGWLLFFQDTGGGYNSADPSLRESPWLTGKPTAQGNWVYSLHDYDFSYGIFSDGVPRHDDYGVSLMNAVLDNARAWHVPLYIGEFTNFNLGVDARTLTDADMAQTRLFVDWAKQNKVSWTFWAYSNPWRPMTMMDYATNLPITVVKNALDSGLDGPAGTNQPPVASFASSVNGLQVALDGSASSDPDGTIASWAWNLGDGRTASGATPTTTYSSSGTYTVTLTVTDDRGATATTSKAVTVTGPLDGPYASDTFSRTVTGGWGTAELGGAWSLSGGATNFSVGAGQGRMSVVPGATTSAALGAVQQQATEVTATLSFDRAQTGGGTYISVVGRRVTASNTYQLQVRAQSTGAVTAQLVSIVNGTETALRSVATVSGLSWTQGEKLRVRFRVSGTAPSVLAARIWKDGDAEPTTWLLTASDSTPTLQANGGVGISTYLSRSATAFPVVVSVDDLVAGPPPGSTPPPNQKPTASFSTSCAGLTCTVDGSASKDPDGTISSYAWTFGDGATATTTTPTAQHTYGSAGTYTVGLTVTDDRGGTASTTRSVTVVANQAPTAALSLSAAGLKVTADGTGSTDPDGTIARYAWGFGDGGTASGATASHTYATDGTYTVTLTVTDDQAATDTATGSVTVVTPANQKPTASFTATTTGATVAVNGSGSSDPDGSIASYAWNFGDGGTATGVTASHTYAVGTYTITLTVTDNGGATDSTTRSVTITDAVLASDDFTRTVSNGWGSADVGGAWTVAGPADRWSVGSGRGQLSLNAGNGYTAFLPSLSTKNAEVTLSVASDKPATGGGQYISVIGRRVSSTADYRAKLQVGSTGAVSLWLSRMSGGTETTFSGGGAVTGLTYAVGDRLEVRLQVTGTSPTTVRAKLWKSGTTEPSAWTRSTTDTTSGLQTAGSVGLYFYASSSTTNSPVVFSTDGFRVRTP